MDGYKFIEKIGKGTHGTIYLLKSSEDNSLIACKSVTGKYQHHALKEIELLSQLAHRRIVKIMNEIRLKNTVLILMEYANYGTLESMIQHFTKTGTKIFLPIIWSILSQVSDALYYLHSKRIIHRDIKPANILINKFVVRGNEYLEFKICDFSLSTVVNSYRDRIQDGITVGTPFYMSPEMVLGEPYDVTIDVWGLGVIIYEMINLRKPFLGATREELYRAIVRDEIRKDVSEDEGLNELLWRMLRKGNKEGVRDREGVDKRRMMNGEGMNREFANRECVNMEGNMEGNNVTAAIPRITSKMVAKNERVRLNLTMLELKYREMRIEQLEGKLNRLQAGEYERVNGGERVRELKE